MEHSAAISGSRPLTYEGDHGHVDHLAAWRFGLWLFIISEAMLFVVLLSTRFILAGTGHPEELNQPLAAIMTVILLSSGWPAKKAVDAAKEGDQAGIARNLVLTMVLGGLFLGLMAYEWAELAVSPASLYGTVFFTTTGLHGLHVLAGIFVYATRLAATRRGAFDAERTWGLENAERYWHFVDAVWVLIYPIFYLI